MRQIKKCGAILALALAVLVAPGDAQAKDKFKIAWSIYVGWMPWGWAADQGIVKKWADKYGIEIEVVQINDYVESINQYTAGGFDGCVMTNMDGLTIPAVGGVDSTALIVGDFSNGNDGIVSKSAKSVAELKGQPINLVELSVSHYLLARALETLMSEVAANPQHTLRAQFDGALQRFVERLRHDPEWLRKGEEIRTYLQTDPTVGEYAKTLWVDLRAALQRDLADADSVLARQVVKLGVWLGESLAADPALRQSFNTRMEGWVQGLAPDVSQFVAQHIQDTVQRWDAEQMSALIELNIGKDLQYIRINGTVVGGLIGLVLFGLSHAREIARAVAGG